MKTWHIETDLIALAMILVVFVAAKVYSGKARKRDKYFMACLIVGFIVTVIDIFSSLIFDYLPVKKGLFYFSQILYHSTNVTAIIAWFLYSMCVLFEKEKRVLKTTTLVIGCLFVVYLVVILCTIFGNYIFSYTPAQGYQRGSAFYIPLATFAVFSAVTCAIAIIFRKRTDDFMIRNTLMFMPILISVGVVLQLTIDGWLMICPMYALGLVVTYLTIQKSRNTAEINNLSEIAYHDALTGVGNREFALTQISDNIEKNPQEKSVLIMLDLDNLKDINDNFGHDAGDTVLNQFGKILMDCFFDTDKIARYGGDEFVVLLHGEQDLGELKNRFKNLLLNINRMYTNGYEGIKVSCSIGVTLSDGELDFKSLLRRADMALYSVKRSGKNGFAFYDDSMSEMEFLHSRIDATASRNVDWYDSYELKQLLGALSYYFPYVISANLTKNTYYAMESSPDMSDHLPVYGSYDNFIKLSFDVFAEEDHEKVLSTFSTENLLKKYEEGCSKVELVAMHKSRKGHYHPLQISCLFGRHEDTTDVRAYIVVRPTNTKSDYPAKNE